MLRVIFDAYLFETGCVWAHVLIVELLVDGCVCVFYFGIEVVV